ncbi:uncharacterized protein LOC142326586 [Lycorma delicatula]|uniref:uncharacterized protein LOC142326586 n=1 Tax=Lycorma delicatula TaxID=130591 RepID=UPI003F519D8B
MKRLSANNELKNQFLREYEDLGHMQEVPIENSEPSNSYYIPNHPVIKEDSSTTEVRVVFDASCKTSSGISLNDISMVGPTVQSKLISIIIKFRTHIFAMTADIEKMYRQIQIHPSQQNLQFIVWREHPNGKIKSYKLSIVTYDTASAPFLATKTLNQLAIDEKQTFPEASKIMLEDFYVDDLMTGANSLVEAKQLQKDIINLAARGGFHLRK